jgi:galactonate dehydratase
MKWDPFRNATQVIAREEEKFAIECVAAVRDAVGPDVDLCIECHGRFNMRSAIRMAHKLEQFDPFFYEEPILHDNADAMAEVARAIKIPIATGERLYTRWEFRPLLEKNAVRIIQPDICHTGGISELKKIAAMAESYYVSFQPHNANGPISTLASVHVDTSTPNFIIQEFFYPYLEIYNELLTEPIEYEGGYIKVPCGPGLGADIREDVVRAKPPKPEMATHLRSGLPWTYW